MLNLRKGRGMGVPSIPGIEPLAVYGGHWMLRVSDWLAGPDGPGSG